ncbi:MFS transporter [Dongia deserti]|uniref:MFS transporter n=1 Tax=Dongia deserti TaxID=2268030 RepID=UPI000E64D215|nr:MFS transporter [Dongia deserti]
MAVQKATVVDRIPWAIVFRALLPFALGYFMSYLFRAVNQVIAPDLITELDLSPGELGRLTAAYLFGFTLFQLPLGLLLDRFGPRRVQTVLLLVSATGAALFALAPDPWSLTVARGILGLGLCGCLMSAFKANAIWLPMPRVALGNSTMIAIGALGVVTATSPADWLAQLIGWRSMFDLLAAATVGVALLIFSCVPKDQAAEGQSGSREGLTAQLHVIGRITRDAVFWRVVPMVATMSGAFIAIQTLWAGRWLSDVAALDRASVADVLFIMAIGFVIGSLTTGWIADRAQRRGFTIGLVVGCSFLLFALSQLLIILHVPVSPFLPWFLFGFAGQAGNLGYATLAAHFGTAAAGRAQSTANLLLFATAWALQWGIGAILDQFRATGEGAVDPGGYHWAFGLVLALQILAVFWYLRPNRRN